MHLTPSIYYARFLNHTPSSYNSENGYWKKGRKFRSSPCQQEYENTGGKCYHKDRILFMRLNLEVIKPLILLRLYNILTHCYFAPLERSQNRGLSPSLPPQTANLQTSFRGSPSITFDGNQSPQIVTCDYSSGYGREPENFSWTAGQNNPIGEILRNPRGITGYHHPHTTALLTPPLSSEQVSEEEPESDSLNMVRNNC